MEELTELAKKQLRFQKIITQLSAAIDQVTVSVEEFHNWIDGLFGRE